MADTARVIPSCGHESETVWIHPKCHPGGTLCAEYSPGANWLRLVCGECHKEVVTFALPEKPKGG